MQSTLQGRKPDAEQGGCLLAVKALDVAEQQDLAVFRGQSCERPADAIAIGQATFEVEVGESEAGLVSEVLPAVELRRFAAAPAVHAPSGVAGDRVEPRADVRVGVPAEAARMSPHGEEGLLGRVLGSLRIPGLAPGEAQQGLLVSIEQRLERRALPASSRSEEFQVPRLRLVRIQPRLRPAASRRS